MFLKFIAISLQILMTVNCQQFKCRYLDEQEISLQETTQNTLERLRRIRQDLQALTDDIIALEQSLNSTNSLTSPNSSAFTESSASINSQAFTDLSASTNLSATPVVEQIEKDDVLNITVGDFRLADVEYIRGGYVRGRAEYFNSSINWGTWGTVCGDTFNEKNADVICKSIGFSSPLSLWTSQAQQSQAWNWKWAVPSDYPINFDDFIFQCNGTEDSLLNCNYTYPQNCRHSGDVIISCKTNQSLPSGINITEGNLRLSKISSQNGNVQGILLVKDSNKWQTVCDDMQNNFSAKLLCKEMNLPFTNASWASKYSIENINWTVTEQTSVLSYYFNCNEQSTQLEQCTQTPRSSYCSHSEDVILTCDGQPVNDFIRYSNQNITVGKFQLAQVELQRGGGVRGRAEFFNETTQLWGTICNNYWALHEQNTKVFCGSLNLPKNNPSWNSLYWGLLSWPVQKWQTLSGQINMESVQCNGKESSLEQCAYTSQHYCEHGEDVIVTCI